MKKEILMLITMMAVSLTHAQKIRNANVPDIVKNTFNKQYPSATEVGWEKENGHYEVNFDINEVDHSVVMDANGNILETEVEIELNQLPAGVLEYLKSDYKGKTVRELTRITDVKGVITYEVEIKGRELIFDESGKFMYESKD